MLQRRSSRRAAARAASSGRDGDGAVSPLMVTMSEDVRRVQVADSDDESGAARGKDKRRKRQAAAKGEATEKEKAKEEAKDGRSPRRQDSLTMEAQPLEYMLDSDEKGDDEARVAPPVRRRTRAKKRRREEEDEAEEVRTAKETVPPTPDGSLHSQSQPLFEPTGEREPAHGTSGARDGRMTSATKKALADLLETNDGETMMRTVSDGGADGSQPLYSPVRMIPYRRVGSTEAELNKAAEALAVSEHRNEVQIPRPVAPVASYIKGRDPVSSLPRASNSGGETQEAEVLSDNGSEGQASPAGRSFCETGETSRFAPGRAADHADARGGSKFFPESSEAGTTQQPQAESLRARVSLSADVEAEIDRRQRGDRRAAPSGSAPTFTVQMRHVDADGETVVAPHDHFLTLLGVLREQERQIVYLESRVRELEQERRGSRVW